MRRAHVLFSVAAAASVTLMGIKCIDTDPAFFPPDATEPVAMDTGTSTDTPGVDAGDEPPPSFVPAVPCSRDGVAEILIQNFEYINICGCEEATGRTCTIPAGTEVTWIFADSSEHNVTSVANTFGASGERLAGRFVRMFDEAGEFPYACSIHPRDMSGYSVVVK